MMSDFKSGGLKILTLGPAQRSAAEALLSAGAQQEQIMDLVAEIHRLKDQVTATQVDRERRVEAALDRANDCADHGKLLVRANEQVNYWEAEANLLDGFRGQYLSMLRTLGNYVGGLRSAASCGRELPPLAEVVDAIDTFVADSLKAYDRVWSKRANRAGRPVQASLLDEPAVAYDPEDPHAPKVGAA